MALNPSKRFWTPFNCWLILDPLHTTHLALGGHHHNLRTDLGETWRAGSFVRMGLNGSPNAFTTTQFYSNKIQLSWSNTLSEASNEGNPEIVWDYKQTVNKYAQEGSPKHLSPFITVSRDIMWYHASNLSFLSSCITCCHHLSPFTIACHLSLSSLILHHLSSEKNIWKHCLTSPEPTSMSCSKRRIPGIMSCAP